MLFDVIGFERPTGEFCFIRHMKLLKFLTQASGWRESAHGYLFQTCTKFLNLEEIIIVHGKFDCQHRSSVHRLNQIHK